MRLAGLYIMIHVHSYRLIIPYSYEKECCMADVSFQYSQEIEQKKASGILSVAISTLMILSIVIEYSYEIPIKVHISRMLAMERA